MWYNYTWEFFLDVLSYNELLLHCDDRENILVLYSYIASERCIMSIGNNSKTPLKLF